MEVDCCSSALPHTTTTRNNAAVRARRCTRVQMLALPQTSGLLAVLSSFLWACVWNHPLQPPGAGAFLISNGRPALLPPGLDAAVPVAGYITRPQQLRCHSTKRIRRRRERTRGGTSGESSLNMNLRMTPSQPHPPKVAFQVQSVSVNPSVTSVTSRRF